jgi:hypothetical protein
VCFHMDLDSQLDKSKGPGRAKKTRARAAKKAQEPAQ